MLNVVNVSKFYGSQKVLDNVSFRIDGRETVGVLGLDGSGKSTMMRILAGYLAPTNGEVTVDGCDPRVAAARAGIGYLAQSSPLPPQMRVREYLRFRAGLKGLFSKRDADKAFDGVSDFCPVRHLANRLINRLDRSERQWVGIADALLSSPEVLVFDDLTGGMDSVQAARAWELITELTGRATIVLSCRVLADVKKVCKRAVILDKGRLMTDGELDIICLENIEERVVTLSIMANEPVRESFRAIPGVRTVTVVTQPESESETIVRVTMLSGVDLRQELSELCARRGWLITEMRMEPILLEDLFRKIR